MSKDIKFKLHGVNEIKKALDQLGKDINDRVTYDLNKAASRIAVAEMKQAVPDSNSTKTAADKVENNIVIKKSKSKTGTLVGFTNRVFYVMFQEFGTKVRKTKGRGKYKQGVNRGRMPRNPWVQKAHQTAFPKVVEFFQTNYAKIVNRSLKSQLRKIRKK